MKKSKYQPNPAEQAARRAKIAKLAGQIKAMSPEQRQIIADRMPVINPDGHALSVNNHVLLALQNDLDGPITMVAGFQQWKKAGRQVIKGQHGFMIRVYAERSDKMEDPETGETLTGSKDGQAYFPAVYVFDVSQTETIEAARARLELEKVLERQTSAAPEFLPAI